MMNNDDIPDYEKSYTFSSFDKLTWHQKIEAQMWICIRTRGIYTRYHLEVIRLEDCVKTNFYGLDLATPIEKNIKYLEDKRIDQEKEFIKRKDNHVYYHPKNRSDLNFKDRDVLKKWLYDWYWNKRFEFVRDLLAHHRGLLWGSRKTGGGKEMSEVEY